MKKEKSDKKLIKLKMNSMIKLPREKDLQAQIMRQKA